MRSKKSNRSEVVRYLGSPLMTHVLPWLSALACIAMMAGTGALAWLTTRTPLRRVPWLARRARAHADDRGSADGSGA
jgi:hypothetical protein